MLGFTFRRLLLIVPTVLGTITILFGAMYVLPGGPDKTAELLAGGGSGKSVPPQIIENTKKKYGLDQPLAVQYGRYVKNIARFDLGESNKRAESVNDIVKRTAPNSLRLAFWALVIEAGVGISIGVFSAVRKYSFADALITLLSTAALAIPVFVLGLVLVLMFAIYPVDNSWMAPLKMEPGGVGPGDWFLWVIPTGSQWRFIVLPAITLACVNTAVVARLTRSSMLEVGEADYVRTARAKGAGKWSVTMKHTLRNALIPVVTLIGLDFGVLVGAAVLTETVFNYDGMGSAIALAARERDTPTLIGLTVVVVIAVQLINLLVDLSYALLDPRIRLTDKR